MKGGVVYRQLELGADTGAVRHLGSVGLDLVAACLTPHDEPDASRSRVAERHRRPGLRFHVSVVAWIMPKEVVPSG
jgi:hypothetical protein